MLHLKKLNIGDPSSSYVAIDAGHSSCKDPKVPSHDIDSKSICNSRLRVAAKSAPTSVVCSPVTSPRRSSNVDFFDPFISIPQEFHDNLVSHSLKVSPYVTVQSPDHSSLRSPGSHSPYLNPKIQDGPQHHVIFSRVWPENNHVDAHPLPLPPGASPSGQSSVQRQSSAMHHSTENPPPMKGQWQRGKLIGRGTFGIVYHATNLYAICSIVLLASGYSLAILCFRLCFFFGLHMCFLVHLTEKQEPHVQ